MIYVAAGLVLAALIPAGILGVAPADRLASGLSNAGVITVAAMLVIAKGIVQTGVVSPSTWALPASLLIPAARGGGRRQRAVDAWVIATASVLGENRLPERATQRLRYVRLPIAPVRSQPPGIDADGISHVINFAPPANSETFAHRIRRTGSVDRTGP